MKKKFSLLAILTLLVANILPIASVYADTPASATIDYNFSGAGAADIFINGVMLDQGEPDPNPPASGHASGTINYNSTGDTVNITLATFATLSVLDTVKINNHDYNIPTDQATLLNNIDGRVLVYDLGNVAKADHYDIVTTSSRSTLTGSFSWSYKDVDKNNDNYVEPNGVISLVKLEYGGATYTSQADIIAANKPYLQYDITDGGAFHEFVLPTGTKVTLKLMPDPGYQLTSFTVNGGEFEPQEEVGVYTFTSVSGNFHLGAHFTKVNDAVKTVADAITSGSITLGNGEIANGTARLDVSNATNLEPAEINGFEQNAGDYNVKTILDISLYKTIYKGNLTESWDDQIRDLQNEATITLQLDPSVDGNDIVIVHQKHDGSYEVIPTEYDPVNHTITFKTSSFSNYAIATRTIAAPNTGAATKDDSSATESNTAIAILGTLALWSLLAFIAKKAYND